MACSVKCGVYFHDTQADSNPFRLDEYVKLSCQAPDKNPCDWREKIKQRKHQQKWK